MKGSLEHTYRRVQETRVGAWPEVTDQGLRLGLLVAAGSSAAAYELVSGHELVAFIACCVPLVLWLFSRPVILLILLGLAIPVTSSLTGGRGGFNLSFSDLLLVSVGAIVLSEAAVNGSSLLIHALRPVVVPVALYGMFMLILLPLHFGGGEVAKTMQRFELFGLPLVVGAYAAHKGRHMYLLKAYIVAATILAVVWQIDSFGMQKNPVGQMIANAVVLLIAVRPLRRLMPCVVVLAPGLLLTGSRGAILALGVSVVVLLAFQHARARLVLTRFLPLALVLVLAIPFLPAALQSRLTTFSGNRVTNSGYSIYVRSQLSQEARSIIDAHPIVGVGVGNFGAANSTNPLPVQDPHEVLLLQAAEGGWGFAACFVVLIVGSSIALFRMRRLELAPVAAAVLVGTAVHGLVDVYWVRGTPLLGWLLVGMAFGSLREARE
jgi:hypothetical protein